ncbi:hypothetical protein EI94DRAFT_1773259 [Lactarius quietus]|nr:hypothetical protein EI94DRAFT_1773259 [Lactarius quietus]
MSTLCEGCGTDVKCSGLYPHFQRSHNPLCKSYQVSLDGGTLPPDSEEAVTVPASGAQEIEHENMLTEYGVETSPTETILAQGWHMAERDGSESDFDASTDKADNLDGVIGRYLEEEEEEEDEAAMAMEATVAEDKYHLEPHRPLVNIMPKNSDNCKVSPEEQYRPYRLQGGYEQPLNNKPFIIKFPGMAGRSRGINDLDEDIPTGAHTYQHQALDDGATNVYAPFLSKTDWEIAQWAKLRGPGSTAFSELTSIEGMSERLSLSFKDTRGLDGIIDKSLPGRPNFQCHVVMVGSKVYEVFYRDIINCIRSLFRDPTFTPYLCFGPEKHYMDYMKTMQMYHDMQTGKWWWSTKMTIENDQPGATITLLTTFQNKCAYPLYLTIGNIPKEMCRKPLLHAYILLAYLPTTCLVHVSNKAQRQCLLTNLYHSCMHWILAPLETAGSTGVLMMCGNGHIYLNYPIFAAFIGNYPEQILTTGSITGECPTCNVDHRRLGDYELRDANHLRDLASDPASFLQSCSLAGIKPIARPFWKELPYTHIFRLITPDILHQIHQGIIKHITAWIIELMGAEEVDTRCRRLPLNHNLRAFTKGISTLSHVTRQEHNQMGRILLALIMDAPLSEGHSNARLQRAICALMDFVFLAQYPLYSTTDNFNTETTERLHIDLTKDAFDASNKKDEHPQMTNYVEHKEKIHLHEQVVAWRLEGSPPIVAAPREWLLPGLELNCDLHMSKTPLDLKVSLETIETTYGAEHFRVALRRYIVRTNLPHLTTAQVERNLWDYLHTEFYTSQTQTVDSIHAYPHKSDALGCCIPARFDTALINEGTGGDTGVNGYRIGRICVIFRLPEKSIPTLFGMEHNIPKHLVYVEWYTAFTPNPDPDNLLYKISPKMDRDSGRMCSIIPLANIRRSVHLFPKFGAVAPQEWKSNTVLDMANVFYVNSFTDSHLYRILC